MQLRFTRPVASRPTARQAVAVVTSRHQQRRVVLARAAEEAVEVADTPLERAKRALESDDVDKDLLATSIADLESEMTALREAAAAAESKAQSLDSALATSKDQLLRLTADFDNFRRRSREESAQLADSVRADVVKDLLPLVDNFELARTNVKAETEGEQKINNSYQSLYKQMVDIFRALGVEPVPTTGTPFDPEFHDAIMREPSSEHPDGTVLQEFRKGFKLREKLLRPAMVKVSYADDDVPAASSEE